jgi:hypothetical protein
MDSLITVAMVLLAQGAVAQVYCVRAIGHTPHHERIFFQKGSEMAAKRVIGDLGPALVFPETVRVHKLFASATGERTNHVYETCLPEVPVSQLWLKCAGNLLSQADVFALLSSTVAVPKSVWTNHVAHVGGRYVFSLVGSGDKKYVIDLRGASTAVVFFPDGTYRCVMDPHSSCAQIAPRRLMDLTTNQPSTCEVHCISMTNKVVLAYYGMNRSAAARELMQARRTLFLHADEPYDRGFCIEPAEKHARIYVCAKCTEARREWLNSNQGRKASLRVTRITE